MYSPSPEKQHRFHGVLSKHEQKWQQVKHNTEDVCVKKKMSRKIFSFFPFHYSQVEVIVVDCLLI